MTETGESIDAAHDRAAAVLSTAQSILIASHRRPDGDGCGGMIALTSLLRGQGRNATL